MPADLKPGPVALASVLWNVPTGQGEHHDKAFHVQGSFRGSARMPINATRPIDGQPIIRAMMRLGGSVFGIARDPTGSLRPDIRHRLAAARNLVPVTATCATTEHAL